MGWLMVLAEAAVAAAAPEPALVEELDVTVRAAMVGDLQEGVQAYRSEFFVAVRPGTAMDMVRWLPGFTFEDTRDLRGLGAAGGNVLIDGQPPTSKTDTLATVLGRIPASQVDRVDIIVGGAPGIDMRGRPVIADVVLKKTTAARGQATSAVYAYQAGHFGAEAQANISRKDEERTFEASLHLRRSIFTGPLTGIGTQTRTDGAGRVLFVASARNQGASWFANPTGAYELPFARGQLRVNGSFHFIKGGFFEDAVAPGVVSSNVLRDRQHRGEAGLRYTRDFGGGLSLESQALQRLSDYRIETDVARPGAATTFDQIQDQSETVVRSSLRWKRDETLTLEGSAEAAFNGLDVDSTRTIGGALNPTVADDLSVRERRGDAGLTLTWKPAPAYGVTAALRAETSTLEASGDVNIERSLTYLKPRLVLSYAPDEKTQIRLRVEHEVNQIGFFNFVSVIEFNGQVRAGNPEIRPKRAWVAEAVYERQFWTGASLVTTLKHQAIRDEPENRLVPGFGDSVEIANVGAASWTDLIGTLTLPLKRLGLDGITVKGAVTRTWTSVTDPTTNQKRRLDTSAWRGDAHFVHDLPQWKLNWGVDLVYSSAWTIVSPAVTEHIPAWPRLSAFVEYRATPTLTLRAEAFNLSGYKTRHVVTYFTGPRPSPVNFSDTRRLNDGQWFMLRVRRSLN